MYLVLLFKNYLHFYEAHFGNKYMFVCFNVFILGNILYMLILLFAFASKLCLIVVYILLPNKLNQSWITFKSCDKTLLGEVTQLSESQ